MYTLQNIKDMYYTELNYGDINIGFNEYVRTEFTPCYDSELNFLGYEKNFTQSLQ